MSKYVVYELFADQVGTVTAIYSGEPRVSHENVVSSDAPFPADQQLPNMDAYLRINLNTNELYYDYIARDTFETKLAIINDENLELKQAIADLTVTMAAVMGGGAQ